MGFFAMIVFAGMMHHLSPAGPPAFI